MQADRRDWKTQGRIRYVGVTHYESGAFEAVEKVLRSEKLDFLQIAFPIQHIDEILTVAKSDIRCVSEQWMFNYRGTTLPVISDVLFVRPSPSTASM